MHPLVGCHRIELPTRCRMSGSIPVMLKTKLFTWLLKFAADKPSQISRGKLRRYELFKVMP